MRGAEVSRTAVVVTVVALAVGLVLDVVVDYSRFPGYPALVGLGGCVAIILVSKWIGTTWLLRPPGYHAEDLEPDVQEDLRG